MSAVVDQLAAVNAAYDALEASSWTHTAAELGAYDARFLVALRTTMEEQLLAQERPIAEVREAVASIRERYKQQRALFLALVQRIQPRDVKQQAQLRTEFWGALEEA